MVSTESGFRFQKSIELICGISILCFEELIKDPWKDFEIRRETICASKGLSGQNGEREAKADLVFLISAWEQ